MFPISHSAQSLRFDLPGSGYFAEASAIVHEVYTAALPIIKSCTSIYNFSLGLNELFWKNSLQRQASGLPEKSCGQKSRGIAYIGAGICDAYVALHSLTVFNLQRAATRISFIGNICFLYANMVTLAENICIFRQAQYDENLTAERSAQIMHSAFLGILGSLGHILATALTLFGCSTAIMILVSILAANASFFKFIMDYTDLCT